MNSEHLRPRVRSGVVALTLGLCALAFVSAPLSAQAEPDAEGQSSEYRELIEQALNEFKHRNWPEARVLFRRAHELSPNARTLRGMGVVSYEMRDYVNAVLALSAALVDARQPLTEAQRKECETLLSRSRTFVGSYALQLEPAEAEVTLDGAPLARDAEGRVLVPFGEHTLRALAPGHQESSSKLSVQGGEQGELRVVLYRREQLAAAPASAAEPQAAPPPRLEAAVPPSQAAPARGFIGGGLRYSWITLGASAAFGAAWAGAWFVGQAKVDDLDAACERAAERGMPCARGEVDTSSVQRFERLSNAMLGLTAAAVTATAVLITLEWPRERQRAERSRDGRADRAPSPRLALAVGPWQLALRGSF